MKQIRMFTMLVAALFLTNMLAANMLAQGSHGLPPVKEQLKMLSDKLSLSSGQQAKVEPILRELHDATEKLMQDASLSQEERLDRVRPLRLNADKKLGEILNDDQKKKLDAYEQGPHPEMHGDLHGQAQPPKL